MPHSHPFGKDWAADIYAVVKPKVVTDIGPGAGMWSDALRPRHSAFWIGVEIWAPYVEKYGMKEKYNAIVNEDVRTYVNRDLWSQVPGLYILGDVLEHIPQADAESVLKTVLTKTNCHVLVSVPIHHYEQGPLEGNPHETHLWHPTHEWAMDTLKPEAHVVGDVVGAYWTTP